MTSATTTTTSSNLTSTTPAISYQVAMQPESHLFEVTLQVQRWQAPVLDFKMPVWTPGSYLVREYSKHLQNFCASTGDGNNGSNGNNLSWRKLRKNHWQIQTNSIAHIVVKYSIFANDLSVRTNHLDATHGYFNPAALFFYIPGFERIPIEITIIPPDDWHITTPLPPVDGKTNTFSAVDFDTLVDSPFEIGCHQLYEFEVLSKPHQLAIWGKGNAQPKQIIQDIEKIIKVEAKIFGGLPYERYLFLLHLSSTNNGGLEHKNACSLNYPRFGFRAKDKYNRFMQLVAHEFFHLWNVKRIRPKELEEFDYEEENYTTSLWFSEGTTSYYDLVIPRRAGIYDAKTFLDLVSKDVTKLQATYGRLVQPVSESSFDAWIKHYRQDANSGNSQISYYLKGELISLLLDLLIRARHGNARSLDDVMLQMWEEFGKAEIGFKPEQLQSAIESVAGINLSDFFTRYIDGTEELPFNEYLQPFGLCLEAIEEDESVPYLGITAKAENGRELIKFVSADSPAQKAGIDVNDELLAIDGIRVTSEQLAERLKDYSAGDTIHLTVFHQDVLCTLPVTLATPQPSRYQIVPLKNPDSAQKQNCVGWLGGLI